MGQRLHVAHVWYVRSTGRHFMIALIRRLIRKLTRPTANPPYRFDEAIYGCDTHVVGRNKIKGGIVLDVVLDDMGSERRGTVTVMDTGVRRYNIEPPFVRR